MADFRVPFDTFDDVEHELDWDCDEKRWTLSEKEIGLGQRWFTGQAATPEQLSHLSSFFRIQEAGISPKDLRRMSPAELAAVHAGLGGATVYAVLCTECGKHWYVYRWETDIQRWAVYGRTCSFSYRRGDSPSDKDAAILVQVRRERSLEPQSPPL